MRPTLDDITVALCDGDRDLDGILALQRLNLAANLPREEAAREGCVTVRHAREFHDATDSWLLIALDLRSAQPKPISG